MPVPAELLQAYQETHYHVYAEQPLVLSIGAYSEQLAKLHQSHGVSSSAFITAWNPYSESLDDTVNKERQQKLCDEAGHRGWVAIPGFGRHPSNNWPGEESILVLGIDQSTALELGKRYGQNAILFSGSSASPEILILQNQATS